MAIFNIVLFEYDTFPRWYRIFLYMNETLAVYGDVFISCANPQCNSIPFMSS